MKEEERKGKKRHERSFYLSYEDTAKTVPCVSQEEILGWAVSRLAGLMIPYLSIHDLPKSYSLWCLVMESCND